MITCTACGQTNEDGELYCSGCKSDLMELNPGASLSGKSTRDGPHTLQSSDPELTHSEQTHVPQLSDRGAITADGLNDLAAALQLEQRSPTPSAAPPKPDPPRVPASAPAAAAVEIKPRLVVLRGEKVNMSYPIYPGKNYIGRTDDKPVDIDLENQEPPDRIWSSRQHAVITFENGLLSIEDLNSLNGTFVNRNRIHPGQIRTLQANDIVQIGTVHLRVTMG